MPTQPLENTGKIYVFSGSYESKIDSHSIKLMIESQNGLSIIQEFKHNQDVFVTNLDFLRTITNKITSPSFIPKKFKILFVHDEVQDPPSEEPTEQLADGLIQVNIYCCGQSGILAKTTFTEMNEEIISLNGKQYIVHTVEISCNSISRIPDLDGQTLILEIQSLPFDRSPITCCPPPYFCYIDNLNNDNVVCNNFSQSICFIGASL